MQLKLGTTLCVASCCRLHDGNLASAYYKFQMTQNLPTKKEHPARHLVPPPISYYCSHKHKHTTLLHTHTHTLSDQPRRCNIMEFDKKKQPRAAAAVNDSRGGAAAVDPGGNLVAVQEYNSTTEGCHCPTLRQGASRQPPRAAPRKPR